jgi:ferritin-like metal-binding protein YciE
MAYFFYYSVSNKVKNLIMKTTQESRLEQGGNFNIKTSGLGNSNEATGLRDLFEDGLKDIYWAEKALTKAVPKMIDNASSPELKEALTEHLAVTEEQIVRLDQVFISIGSVVQAKKCDAMEGLIKEGNQVMESTAEGVVRDAGIIAAAQKVEHYEIASYGTLCAYAKILNETEAAELLLKTLNEEKQADDKLSEVAEASINLQAAADDIDLEAIDEEEQDLDDEEDLEMNGEEEEGFDEGDSDNEDIANTK